VKPRCKHCKARIKWIETEQGWRVFDYEKRGPYRAHVCKKEDLPKPVYTREIPDPWWNKD
jgi:hypothetical protein